MSHSAPLKTSYNPTCRACVLDMHACPGCGDTLSHGHYACDACLSVRTEATTPAPTEMLSPWPNGREVETEVELVVKARHFGKPDQRYKFAYSVARLLNISLKDDTKVYMDGTLVPFDRVLDDGHAPPAYQPSDTVIAAAYEPLASRKVQGPVWAGKELPRP